MAVLGLITNIAYGVAYYAYGVLIDPIHNSTGWSPAALGATFSAVLVLGGAGGVAGGRLVDRLGPRPAFLIAAAVGSAGLAIASVPSGLLTFAIPYALGCGVVSALGFYHITQPAAMRAAGDPRDRAVVWLTILGAFGSPIFLPLTAWLVHTLGWPGALRVQAVLTLVVFSGDVAIALLYSGLAGASIGAVYTLQGIYTHELVGKADLALVMGAQQALFAIGGALGPAIAGVLIQAAHGYTPVLLLTTAGFLIAAITIATGARPQPNRL